MLKHMTTKTKGITQEADKTKVKTLLKE